MRFKIIIGTTLALITILLFQNCQGGKYNFTAQQQEGQITQASTQGQNTYSNPDEVNAGNSFPQYDSAEQINIPPGVTSPAGSNGNSGSIVTSQSLKVLASSSTGAKLDCSRTDATLTQEIQNAGSDILLCAEYTLDMPVGSSRRGATNKCDSSSKFSRPQSNWTYNQAERKWTSGVDRLRNHSYIVPGTYALVVKDNVGKIYRSQAVVVKRTNFENCSTSQASSSGPTVPAVKSCQWVGIVVGPENIPTGSCSNSNVGATARNDRNTVFTCTCR